MILDNLEAYLSPQKAIILLGDQSYEVDSTPEEVLLAEILSSHFEHHKIPDYKKHKKKNKFKIVHSIEDLKEQVTKFKVLKQNLKPIINQYQKSDRNEQE